MLGYTKLKGRMFERGVKQRDLLPIIGGRSMAYLSPRISQKKPWKADEIKAIAEFLEIPSAEWAEYFF